MSFRSLEKTLVGEFDGCEGRIRPFLDNTLECVSGSVMIKNALGSRRRRIKQEKILPLLLHALVMPPCSDRPRKCSLSGGETAFVVFVVLIPRADRGVVYMRVLEKIDGFGGFVTTGIGLFEHVRRR